MFLILTLSLQLIVFLTVVFIAWRTGQRLAKLRILKDQIDPPPPRNIRLHLHNGDVIGVSSVLSPMRTWRVLVPSHLTDDDIDGISVDELPALTALDFKVRRAEG